MKYYLYNSLANNGIKPDIAPGIQLIDAVGLDYAEYLSKLSPEDEVVLIGGDGTLNYFINAVKGVRIKNNIYLLGSGTGNDFLTDIGRQPGEEVLINDYLVNLPTVYVNGIEKLFINNMGFGIDGYCCEVADKIKERSPREEINYSGIAIKGLLFHFKPCHAAVTVDGKTYEFDNVWIAPTMKGRYYGGGMDMAPDQDRSSDKLSVVIYHCRSKLKALMAFPSIFKGEHVKKTDMVSVFTGNDISVRFSRPCAAQIDGETVLDVMEYRAVL
ncbi:MAG: diacylglycerol kinase family protein [Oscillospiraceae bacterium]|nr:diacylglycerol kinase family protein [Oscillospiraceae bacterium]